MQGNNFVIDEPEVFIDFAENVIAIFVVDPGPAMVFPDQNHINQNEENPDQH